MEHRKYKIVYCTPSLYIAGGVERVLTAKVNYFAEHFGYNITIILTDGKDKPFAFPLSDKVKVVNLDINFEELWNCSFLKQIWIYLRKQRIYKKRLTEELMRLRPDITDSLLRREINFIGSIKDGSKKVGELHTSRQNNRNYKDNEINFVKAIFAKYWNWSLVRKLRRLDKFVVLTREDRDNWGELSNVVAIPNPVSFTAKAQSRLTDKRVLAVGRYDYVKGFDRLLKAWSIVEKRCPEWSLAIYGDGDSTPYQQLRDELRLDADRCRLNGATPSIQDEYLQSSMFVVPSRFEGLSMAMLEAISCGLPLVAFACPCGPRDVVDDGVNGFLVENGNVEQLAERIIEMIEHPEKRLQMGLAARQKSEAYKMENLAVTWQNLFDSLMSKD
jgi:glycosyltransferase involved in cell wall biosynthesis